MLSVFGEKAAYAPQTEQARDQYCGVNQAGQLTAALRLAASQPHVGAYFNFLLWDEARLEGWQSGLYWTDRTPKPSAPAFEDAVCGVHAGGACGSVHSLRSEPEPTVTRARSPSPPSPLRSSEAPLSCSSRGVHDAAESPAKIRRRSLPAPRPPVSSSQNDRRIPHVATGVRVAITLACVDCKRRNYQSNKSKRNTPDRVELKKYCRWCGRHTAHRETR